MDQEHPGLTKNEKKKICSLMDCKKLTADACMHAVQNERLPLRLVVQILFFEQVRGSAAARAIPATGEPGPAGSARSLLSRENGYGSSRSTSTANIEDGWDGIPTARDVHSIKSMHLVGRDGGGSERSSGSRDADKTGNGKVKGLMPKNLLSMLWSNKRQSTENSSSDTSLSPGGSINLEEMKSTPSRNTRHSVS